MPRDTGPRRKLGQRSRGLGDRRRGVSDCCDPVMPKRRGSAWNWRLRPPLRLERRSRLRNRAGQLGSLTAQLCRFLCARRLERVISRSPRLLAPLAPMDYQHDRPLPDSRAPRPGRDGCRLPRLRSPDRAHGRHQGDLRPAGGSARAPRAVLPRGARRRPARAPQHHHDLRPRRRPRPAVHRDGVRRGASRSTCACARASR